MGISKIQFAAMLRSACEAVISARAELTEIDSRFGDADHGVTMTKIAEAIIAAADSSEGTVKTMLDDTAAAVMMINGGSAVPLWNTYLTGLAEGAPAADEISPDTFREIFRSGLAAMQTITKAGVGDKTMMDTLIPATGAIAACGGGIADMLEAAAGAAAEGAENTENMIAKFGRARSYGEATIGTPDAGAVSMKYFFAGLAGK